MLSCVFLDLSEWQQRSLHVYMKLISVPGPKTLTWAVRGET